jgi:transcriptional regulator with XRE-family HTH domain
MQLEPVVKLSDIGMRIRQYRQDAGLSQEKLAELVGVTPQQIQKYESAKTRISTDKIQLIASALQIHAADFFSERTHLTLNAPETIFIKKLRKVRDPEVHESLVTLLEKLAG